MLKHCVVYKLKNLVFPWVDSLFVSKQQQLFRELLVSNQ